MVHYVTNAGRITERMLEGGFFDGWPNPPSPAAHLRLLQNSEYIVLAVDDEAENEVIGFITAITDGVLCAYIPLLEVLPRYRNHGIGNELVRRMMEMLAEFYMIDLSCDTNLKEFYEAHQMSPALAMIKRNYSKQAGRR